jgi:tetratricopeptide (TPR) repeat protein
MSRLRVVLVGVLLALATLLVYLPTGYYGFADYDDREYVTQNPMVQAGLTWSGVKWAFTTTHASNWHPLTWLSHMLDCQLFGLSAGGPHLVNVLFHTLNAVLLFLLLLRLTSAFWQSALIAALFAWHPLRVESVAWVAERKDVLSACFGLLTLMAYVHYAQRRKQGKAAAVDYGLAWLFFALGLMSKPMLVTLPFIFLLLDYWPLQRAPGGGPGLARWSRLVWEKGPFLALAAASCVVTFIAQQHGEAVAPLASYPLRFRLENAVVAYADYLLKSVWPVHLAVIYPLSENLPLVSVLTATLTLILISWLAWRRRRPEPYLLTGWLWFLGMLVPVIGLVQAGMQSMADRYTYLPQIGLFLGVTFCIGHWAAKRRLNPVVMISVAGIVLAGCLILTARQLQYWRDSETLFRHALAVTQDNPVAQNNFGTALLQEGRMDEAMAHFQKAVEIDPDYAVAHDNLGNILLQKGRVDEAIAQFQKALEAKPDYAEVHYNLGIILLQRGQVDEAIAHYQRALEAKPDFVKAHYNLGNILLRKGQVEEAITHYQKALAIQPDYADAHFNLATALLCQGRVAEAVAQYRKTVEFKPDAVAARDNLAWVLATCPDASVRNGGAAIAQAEEANRLVGGNNPKILCTLAAAYAEAGRFPEAVATAQRALQLATTQDNADLVTSLRTQLASYQTNAPFRDVSLTNGAVAEAPP